MSNVREWLVGVKRVAQEGLRPDWTKTVSSLPGIVVRPRGSKVVPSGPVPISVEVLATERDAANLRIALGPDFSVQPLLLPGLS